MTFQWPPAPDLPEPTNVRLYTADQVREIVMQACGQMIDAATPYIANLQRAVEHAEYFAQAVEAHRRAQLKIYIMIDEAEADPAAIDGASDALADQWVNVGRLMHEFRKRAERANGGS